MERTGRVAVSERHNPHVRLVRCGVAENDVGIELQSQKYGTEQYGVSLDVARARGKHAVQRQPNITLGARNCVVSDCGNGRDEARCFAGAVKRVASVDGL